MAERIDHKHTYEIVCPWCGYEHSDSWEKGDSGKDVICENCWNTYDFDRDVEVTYSTVKKEKYEG